MPTHTSASHDLVVKDLVCKARYNILFIEVKRNSNRPLNFLISKDLCLSKREGVGGGGWGEGRVSVPSLP